jgi:hypothetical protein
VPGIAEWQVGSIGYTPAVLQPALVDFTVAGHSTDGYASDGYVNDDPALNGGKVTLYDGFVGYAVGGTVHRVRFFYIPGKALEIGRPGSPRYGQILPFDRLKWNLTELSVFRVFSGIHNHATDSYMSRCEVASFRDWGFRLSSAVQFDGLHAYGGTGPGVWLEGYDNHGDNIYPETTTIGLKIDGRYNKVTGCYSHTCSVNCIQFNNIGNQVIGFDLSHSPVPVLIAAGDNVLRDGTIELLENGTGIHIKGPGAGDGLVLCGLRIAGYHDKRNNHPQLDFATGATAILAEEELNDCDIQGRAFECTTGINFAGGIGHGNRIWLNFPFPGVTNPVIWPPGETWSTSEQTNETNDIRINGVRFYRQPQPPSP